MEWGLELGCRDLDAVSIQNLTWRVLRGLTKASGWFPAPRPR